MVTDFMASPGGQAVVGAMLQANIPSWNNPASLTLATAAALAASPEAMGCYAIGLKCSTPQ